MAIVIARIGSDMTLLDICFSADDNCSEQLAVSIASILETTYSENKHNIYILDGGISDKNKTRIKKLVKNHHSNIEFISVNSSDFDTCPMLKDENPKYSSYHVTKPTYFRFKLPTYLPLIEKVLYLDCDIIAMNSLSDLYNTDIQDYYTAMIPDIDSSQESERLQLAEYFNAGVMLINLKKWREENIQDKLFGFANENRSIILWQDQDVFNLVFKNNIKPLPHKWNYQIDHDQKHKQVLQKDTEINILHFAGRFKPWLNYNGCKDFEAYYYYLYKINWLDNMHKYKSDFVSYILKQEIYKGKIAEEINKIYEHIDNKKEELSEEINKIYAYINSKNKDLLANLEIKSSETNDRYFNEQKKVYEFINSQYKDFLGHFEIKSAEADKKYFDEQKKVYEFINSQYKDFLGHFEIKSAEADKKYFSEQEKIYEYVNYQYQDLQNLSNMKFSDLDNTYYGEQTKIYEYINERIGAISQQYESKIENYENRLGTIMQELQELKQQTKKPKSE